MRFIPRPRHLFRSVLSILVLSAVVGGCSHAERRGEAQALGADPGAEAYQAGIDRFAARLEASRSLSESGDVARFQASRDSLVADVNAFIRENPHAEEDAAFVGILNALSALDTLASAMPQTEDGYSAVDDSLALANAEWPTNDVPEGRIFNRDNALFPVVESTRIDFWLSYFTGPGRERFERALYRMQLHRPTMESILDEMDLPRELICVAFIESGFAMKAVSRARAVGPWQFITGTGRRYGLRVNWWYDERCDIVASTYAAANYLQDLYAIWGDWYLALAAYNCGEYRVARQVARQNTTDFWKLDLPLQTERYVPKFLAALYILREPEKYGFDIPQVEPIRFDLVPVEYALDLDVLARCAGTTTEVIRELNPQLRRGATPPNMEVHIKVPPGVGESCAANILELPPEERVAWSEHRVRKGETLSEIAAHYGTSVTALRDANGLSRRGYLQIGQRLVIPVPGGRGGAYAEVASSKPTYRDRTSGIDREALERYAQRAAKSAPPPGRKRVVYTVKRHDTLSEIAAQYHVGLSRIRSWNNLSRRRHIYPGQKLVIYVPESYVGASETRVAMAKKPVDETHFVKQKHVVASGESFYSISRRYNVSVSDLMAWNGRRRSIIRPGDVLVVYTPRTESGNPVGESGGR